MEKYVPDMYKKSIYEIDYSKLKEIGIKCLLFDLDNTIVPYNEKIPSEETVTLFKKLVSMEFKVIIFSNSPKLRVKPIGDILNVEVFGNAKKPFIKNYYKVLNMYKFTENEVAIIGDQMLTDIVGGNKVGITTILVEPIINKDPIWTKPNRIRERRIMKKLRDNNLFSKGRYYEKM